ncbi:hypothetical protein PO002_25520 [Cupriavidus necator]|uniref:hypothetical protein n=1 Tax=Cupriavidus necator TaxID=106590 RepID=UPI0039C019A9
MQSTLMIKDLPLDKELDGKTMSAVRGGHAVSVVDGNYQNVIGGGGFASPTTGVQVGATVNTIDASSHIKLEMPTLNNFGGTQLAAL